jgi:acetyltransferase-like isoleucine patch superfamily enzyme
MTGAHLEHDWFPAPLPDAVRLGARSWLYSSFAFRHFESVVPEAVVVGEDSGIYHGTFFDLGPRGSVRIGDFCSIVGAIFCTDGRITIDDYAFIAHEVVLADGAFAVPGVARAARSAVQEDTLGDVRSIHVGRNAWVGARAVLLAGARIGENSIVGAGAVVDFEVPPSCIVAGNPARVVGSIRGA